GLGFGNPDPSHRLSLLPDLQGLCQRQALWGCQGLHPIDAGAAFALILLSDSPHSQEPSCSRLHQEVLESVDCSHIVTTRGSVDAFLQLEDVPLEMLPRERLPSIHRCYCRRGHSVSTATHPSTFHVTGAPSAYPVAFPRAFASEPIPLLTRMRWTPTSH